MADDVEMRAREALARAYEAAAAPSGEGTGRYHAANVRVIGKRDYADWKDHAAIRAMIAFAASERADERERAARAAFTAIQATLDGYASGTPKSATGDNAIRGSAMLNAANLIATAIRAGETARG